MLWHVRGGYWDSFPTCALHPQINTILAAVILGYAYNVKMVFHPQIRFPSPKIVAVMNTQYNQNNKKSINQTTSKLTTCFWKFVPAITAVVPFAAVTYLILTDTHGTWRRTTAIHVLTSTLEGS